MQRALAIVAAGAALVASAPHQHVEVHAVLSPSDVSALPIRTSHFVVGGFVNNGDSTMNVTGVSGGLYDPTNIYAKLVNVTGMPVKTAVPAGDEITLELPFQVPIALPHYPYPMQLLAIVHYKDERGSYSSVLVNQTVTFVALEEAFDPLQWLPNVVVLGCLALFTRLFLAAAPGLSAKLQDATADQGSSSSSSNSSNSSSSSSVKSFSGSGGSAATAAAAATTSALREAGYRAKLIKLMASLNGKLTAPERAKAADDFLSSLSSREIPESGNLDHLVYHALAAKYGVPSVKAAIKHDNLMKATALEQFFSSKE